MKKIFKIIFALYVFFYTFFYLLTEKTFAANRSIFQIFNDTLNPNKPKGASYQTILELIEEIIRAIIDLILIVIPIFALIMIMYAGLQYIFSAGNPKKNEEAIKLLNSSIIGFAAFLMLYALWGFIKGFIGI